MEELTELECKYTARALRAAIERVRKFWRSEEFKALESALAKIEGRPAEEKKPAPEPPAAMPNRRGAPRRGRIHD